MKIVYNNKKFLIIFYFRPWNGHNEEEFRVGSSRIGAVEGEMRINQSDCLDSSSRDKLFADKSNSAEKWCLELVLKLPAGDN